MTSLEPLHLDRHDLTTTQVLLQRWAEEYYGRQALVEGLYPMPGHAGISFGFDVVVDGARDPLVVRVPPAGVRRSGNTDVLRQVPVLEAAREAGVRVAKVRFWGSDEQWFGVPYMMVERLSGTSLECWEPAHPDAAAVTGIFTDATQALVAIHRVPWRSSLPGWGQPRNLREEIDFWLPVLAKGASQNWIDRCHRLRADLLERMPPEPEPALVHGDFYSNNWVCAGDRLLAVVDWEIASIGPPLLDVAWLCMIYDPSGWGPIRRPWMTWAPSPEQIAADYEHAVGRPVEHLGWYRGLAAWRFGAIIALNYRLHVEGRRFDPTWDLLEDSFDAILHRGEQLLADD